MRRVVVAPIDLAINGVPLETLSTHIWAITVLLDDEDEVRHGLKFVTWQALRITTTDCFDYASIFVEGQYVRRVLCVEDSPWIAELKRELHQHDESATFMDLAHHFVLPLGDGVTEIIAHSCQLDEGPDAQVWP